MHLFTMQYPTSAHIVKFILNNYPYTIQDPTFNRIKEHIFSNNKKLIIHPSNKKFIIYPLLEKFGEYQTLEKQLANFKKKNCLII